MAGLYGWHVMRFVELLIEHYAGAELHDQMNFFQASWNNDAVVQALTKYKEFCDKGYFPVGFITADPQVTYMAIFAGTAAMDVEGPWWDPIILNNNQNINNYKTFPFPSGGTNRMSAFVDMIQFNKNLSPKKLDACMKFLNEFCSPEMIAKYGREYVTLPLPRIGAEMPAGRLNVPDLLNASNKNSTFTITDQALPTEVADELFRVQEGIANGQMSPREGAARIQAAVEAYKKK
jgi:raffinose/stachyose/melibiose transport system substrate-binding protein